MKAKIVRYPPVDALVCEATLFGCWLAWRLGQEGKHVALATAGMSPFREAVDLMRPWCGEAELAALPEPFGGALRGTVKKTAGGRAYFHSMRAIRAIEDLLLNAGCTLYYGARPAGTLEAGGRVGGVVFGGSFGLVAVGAGCVVDLTPFATVARLAGARFVRAPGVRTGVREVSYVVHTRPEREYREVRLGGGAGTVRLHDRYAEFDLTLKGAARGPLGYALTLGDVHAAVRAAAQSLARRSPPAVLDSFRGADECFLRPADALVAESDGFTLPGFANLFAAGPCSPLAGAGGREAAGDCTWWFRAAPGLAEKALGTAPAEPPSAAAPVVRTGSPIRGRSGGGASLHFTDPAFTGPTGEVVEAEFGAIPEADGADLVVAGGGTGGLPAALHAARAGLKTVCLEAHGEPGGALTVGGVSKLWFGRWTPALEAYYLPLFEQSDRERIHPALVLNAVAREGKVRMVYAAPVCGVARKGRALTAAFVLTPHGLAAVRGRIFADATGDGNLSAWAGAPYTWGSERDEITLWYSLGAFLHGEAEASRLFLSVVDMRSMADVSRAVVAARRQTGSMGEGEYPQYSIIPRETRHITGDATVTYLDLLMGRGWDDTAIVCESNIDIKGIASSDLALAGFVDHDYTGLHECPVPYRALLPRGLDNVIMACRAYSITHDALSMARMQPDMAALGMAAGTAASLARRTGGRFRNVPVRQLQGLLLKAGVLLPSDIGPAGRFGGAPGRESLAMLVRRLATGPMHLRDQARIISLPRAARPLLEREVREENYYGIETISRMLCATGAGGPGADWLLKRLGRELEGAALPPGTRRETNAPNHGLAPHATYWMNALALARDARLVPLLERVAERLALDPAVSDYRFYYAHSLSYAGERLASPPCIPPLRMVLADPVFREVRLPRGSDPRSARDHVRERNAYLELCLGRALARCGDAGGYRVLFGYLTDMRLFLARSAWLELRELSGADLGFDPAGWEEWLGRNEASLRTAPYRRSIA